MASGPSPAPIGYSALTKTGARSSRRIVELHLNQVPARLFRGEAKINRDSGRRAQLRLVHYRMEVPLLYRFNGFLIQPEPERLRYFQILRKTFLVD